MKATVPGVMLSLYQFGVLLQGKSGIGKSELALALLDRGHQLVSDDAVQLQSDGDHIMASAPEKLRGYLGLRNIGIIPVETLFGADAVCTEQRLDLIINLIDDQQTIDPLPSTWPNQITLGCDIPAIALQQKSGRQLALVVESAVKFAQTGYRSHFMTEDRHIV
ncbi:MAG: hypothetical protein M3R00_00620 [Pseudomonadota bacterium]|nr:hypothetical protein [Pseudomonadota bacterium]